MTSMLDPLETSRRMRDSYRRYLVSTFSPRSRELRADFESLLAGRFPLTRGPILEASAPFEPGASIADLVEEGVLSRGWYELASPDFPIERPLHLHQEQAVRRAVTDRRNLLISTGTGSGKTETFLVPIIEGLLREREAGTLGRPGVRALLLYPMNALANDQTKRLRGLLGAFSEITFGRYTGETRQTEAEAEEDFRSRYPGEPRVAGELISRDRMRTEPPHILLTNFAMLEYLLLRPHDTAFFDGETGQHWRSVVLDEAHVYSGAQGAEVAMLLRRVRDRVNRSQRGRLQCFATSATLGRGIEDHPKLIDFGQRLFDEDFAWDPKTETGDVITATRLSLVRDHDVLTLGPDRFRELQARVRDGATVEDVHELVADVEGAFTPEDGEGVPPYLERLLRGEHHVRRMQKLLEGGSVELRRAASTVFGGDGTEAAVVALVDLCVKARSRVDDTPLLPARYHFFLRALEGAFVCHHPAHRSGVPRLHLNRHATCRTCSLDGAESTMFELGVCRHCRSEYLVGRLDPSSGIFHQPGRYEDKTDYLLIGEALEADDEDEAALEPGSGRAEGARPGELCTGCGQLDLEGPRACGCVDPPPRVKVAWVQPPDDDVFLRRCISCSGRSPGEVVFRFQTGTDAPVAVIATELYQAIPPAADLMDEKVGEGRKLLTFSDSRQDAAFFAPYLERTYNRAVQRRLIAAAIDKLALDEPPRSSDLVTEVRRAADRALVIDPDASRHEQLGEVQAWVIEELFAFDRRQSLEGSGVAEIAVVIPRGWKPPSALLRLGFSEEEVVDLIQLLLETVRSSGAVSMPDHVDVRDVRFQPRNIEIGLRQSGSEKHVISWLPTAELNRRLEIVEKALARKSIEADARDLLEGIWRHLSDPNGKWAKTFDVYQAGRKGTLHRIHWDRFELIPASEDHLPLRCSVCRKIWWRTVGGLCPAWHCQGTVSPITDLADLRSNHYVSLYRTLAPIGLEVEEHTAQWMAAEASRIQDRFIDGDVNILSCSTTFELGVDVGEIQAVLLRNVPPSAANYVQRAGRAGRRVDSAALVVTFAQRRSHDLTFFGEPHQMVDGYVVPPTIVLDNPSIARRHAHAVAFAQFERELVDAGEDAHGTVVDFFLPSGDPGSTGTGVEGFETWMRRQPVQLQEALERVLPAELHEILGVTDWSWVDALVALDAEEPAYGWLRRAREEVAEDMRDLDEMIAQAFAEERGSFGDHLKGVRRTLARRHLLGFLASRNVLPKYGFPVDVVSLNVAGSGDRVAANLDLSRDLNYAIGEYAPGSSVVAAKTLWVSRGLRTRAGQPWPTYNWAVCGGCGAFLHRLAEIEQCDVCGSFEKEPGKSGRFALPLFGFVGRKGEKPGESRPLRMTWVETHFSDYRDVPPEPALVEGLNGPVEVLVRQSKQGQIVAMNRGIAGRGFRICERCGHSEPVSRAKKQGKRSFDHDDLRRVGSTCRGTMLHLHLGHHYLTDVVEIRFDAELDHTSANSLLYAILSGVEAVGVAAEDVDGTLFHHDRDASPALVVFDTVAGGAGHSFRIAERLPEVLRAALGKVETCECGPETSCYSCLRNYRNQRLHETLRRDVAIDVLSKVFTPVTSGSVVTDFEEVDERARPLLRAALLGEHPVPTVGWETPGGHLVELAWEDRKVAVVVDDDDVRDRWLEDQGWRVFESTARSDVLDDALGLP